ncbi:MAG: glycoside hydrolase family 3 N-terminal domain-containing protein [Niabella sp.]
MKCRIAFGIIIGCLLNTGLLYGQSAKQRAEVLLKQMTLDEKIGQLNQYNGDWAATGPITADGDKQSQIRKGMVGSMLNVAGVDHTTTLQKQALQSRLKIPLLFGQDVIHGYRTIFPIPLAEAASWDLNAIERSARIAATEAAACGIHWTFAPMVDISRDPRWGRVMEGAGEDAFLGSKIAAARVKGFQGKGLGNTDAVMACAKHFAAYGAAVGGRDYNAVDMSLRQLWETYLPPFKAAVDAGAATVMNSFNDLNGIPATGNKYLQREVLKDKWNFNGFVVSDWGSIGEMIPHGFAANEKDAAYKAIIAGSDMDMESRCYINNLAILVKEKKVPIGIIDDAVLRILTKKFELGLFDDPFRFSNAEREKALRNVPEYMDAARDMARKSIVLLKNNNNLLPLKNNGETIAFIGPFVKAVSDNLGFWSMEWPDDSTRIISQWEGVRQALKPGTSILYAKGCNINDDDTSGFSLAVAQALKADVVIMSMGEARDMSGEAKSRASLQLPGVQEKLIKAVYATGKPLVILINAGRPLVFNWTANHVPAILYTWWLGTQAGHAIADVLFGQYNPSAKLPITFPLSEGQIPMYYNHYNTGRPAPNDSDRFYRSAYIDISLYPQFPFGYGLSYTQFKYTNFTINADSLRGNTSLQASITVTNVGDFDGEEIVQLYIRDWVGSVVRPVKELKGFEKIFLKKRSSHTIHFEITPELLKFYNNELQYDWETGNFDIMIGANAANVLTKTVYWEK